jgi:hypothetical protein
VTAQNQKLISGNFAGYHFPQLVREIEKQTSYHIYYDSTDTDSLEIKLNANEMTLQQVFDAVFKGTDVHYAVGNENNVFVSKRYNIQTTLPKNFFDPGKNETDSSAQTAFFAEDAIAPKSNLKISSDNKLYDIGTKNRTTNRGWLCTGYKNRRGHYGRQYFCRHARDQQGDRSIRLLYSDSTPWASYYPDQQCRYERYAAAGNGI